MTPQQRLVGMRFIEADRDASTLLDANRYTYMSYPLALQGGDDGCRVRPWTYHAYSVA